METSRKRKKILAISSGALVLGIGITYSLATWTDTEWIWGGLGGEAGVGTSTFEVEQNREAGATGSWDQLETNPGGALTFTANAIALTPGDSTYAPVALRTTSNSVAGDVALQPAVAATGITINDAGGHLWNAIEQRVATSDTTFTCDATAFDDTISTITVIGSGALGDPVTQEAAPGQGLDAQSGSTQFYCFELTLPSTPTLGAGITIDELMGRTIAPAWEFQAASN